MRGYVIIKIKALCPQGQGHTEKYNKIATYVLCKTLVPWLCSRLQPEIKVIIRGLRGHLLHTVTFLGCFFFFVFFFHF